MHKQNRIENEYLERVGYEPWSINLIVVLVNGTKIRYGKNNWISVEYFDDRIAILHEKGFAHIRREDVHAIDFRVD